MKRVRPLVSSFLVPFAAFLTLALVAGDASAAGGQAAKAGKSGKAAASRPAVGGKRVVKTGGDSRAWGALKQVLPADVVIMGQLNLGALRGSSTFQQIRALAEKDRKLSGKLGAMKSECKLDLAEAVSDIAFAGTDSRSEKMIVAIAFKGVSEDDLRACAERVFAKEHGGKTVAISVTRSGAISEYVVPGQDEHMFAAWLAPDVLAFSGSPSDRAVLEKLIGGKGAFTRAAVPAKALAMVNASALAWGAYMDPDDLEGSRFLFGVGTLGVATGLVTLDVSLVLADAKGASDVASKLNAELAQVVGSGGLPPMFANILRSVKIVANAELVQLSAAVAEADLLALFQLL